MREEPAEACSEFLEDDDDGAITEDGWLMIWIYLASALVAVGFIYLAVLIFA